MKLKHVGILSAGHLASDLNQGALPAMLPFFIAAYDLSYAAAATIVFAVNMSSSVIQPLFGIMADRLARPWLLPLGLVLAGLGLGLSGLAESYRWIVIFGIISGIGIAAYHPEAARLVNLAAGTQKSTAMSIFGIGGTLGFTFGPLLISGALLHWGLPGSLILLAPVSLMALILLVNFPMFSALEEDLVNRRGATDLAELKNDWYAFARIAAIVCGRSVIFFGLNIFIPLYWIHELGQSKAAGALALSVFAGSGIIGNISGGSLADRIGQKRVLVLGLSGLAMVLPSLLFADGVMLALALLVPTGFLLFAVYSPTIVLGQKYLPSRVGFSSGVTIGLSVAIGGGAAPFIGRLADLHGLWAALCSISLVPPLILLLALTLPVPLADQAAEASRTGRRHTARLGQSPDRDGGNQEKDHGQ